MGWDEVPEAGRTWRVRARLADEPGTLAALAAHLGRHGCNLLSVAVLPVAGESAAADEDTGHVVDELVLRAPASLTEGKLTGLVETHGGRCVGISTASVRDLVDAQTTVLRAASDALSGASTVSEALRRVLDADGVRPVADDDLEITSSPTDEVGAVRLGPGGHRATITVGPDERVIAERAWAPFTDGELSRAHALTMLLASVGRPPGEPRPRGRHTPTCVTSSAQADPLVRQLTSLDAQFLNAETSTMPTHVGIMAILDPATAPGGCLTVEEVRSLVGSRLHLIDPLRWRLRQVPLGLDLPYWVDSVTPDLEHHIREIGLPVPGTDEQLAEQVARLAETPLRREHPLWECYLIHGVAGGRQALYMKVHHAVIDGVSGAEVLAVLMDLHAEPSATPAPAAAAPRPATSTVTLLGKSVWHLLSRPTQLLRDAPMMVPHLLELPGASSVPGAALLGAAAGRVGRLAHLTSAPQLPPRAPTAPPTPFNGPVTPDRCYAFTSVSLPEVKAIKTALGLTINDVVMALCTTALRRWLIDHQALPDVPLVAAMPVSVRTPEQMGTGGNQISFMLCALPTTEPDPTKRLRLLNASLTGAKKRFAQTPATLLHAYSTVLPQLFHGVASRALFRAATIGAPPFNLFISNVAGPQLPLYTAGTAVTGLFPVSVVSDIGGGINITVLSYNGHLDFGILACRQMVPDVGDLADHLHDALAELTDRTTHVARTATTATPARMRDLPDKHPEPACSPA